MSALGGVVVLHGGGRRSAWRASSRMRERATVGGVSGEARLAGFAWAGIRAWVRLWGGVGGGVGGVGCIVVAEFGVKGLHFLHADVVDCT